LKNDITAFEKSSVRKNVTVEAFRSTKIFNHFFYWGMLTVSGDCGHVHPTSVGEVETQKPKQKPSLTQSLLGGAAGGHNEGPMEAMAVVKEGEEEDDEVATLLKEIEWLRLEGNHKDADRIENKVHKLRLEKLKKIRKQ
jgi:hypothetical protein